MSSSFLENYPSLMTAGPAPGTPTVIELYAGSILVIPNSYYGLSGLDGQWFRTANNYLVAKYGGGEIRCICGSYNLTSTVPISETVSLYGIPGGTIINWNGTGTCISHHGSNDSFTPIFNTVGAIKGITIDGSGAGNGSVGLDVGDGWGHDVDVVIRHFNGTGSIGLWLNNNNVWSEKCSFKASVMDCTNCVVIDVNGGLPSHMYSDYLFYLFPNGGQQGIVVQGGSEPSRCNFRVRGNGHTNSGVTASAMFLIQGAGSHMTQCFIDVSMEANGTDATAPIPFNLAAAGNTFTDCFGKLTFLNVSGNTSWGASILNDKWNFTGVIVGDSTLSRPAQPTLPASGVVYTNINNPAMVYVTGGTVTQISVNGVATGLTSGSFFLRANTDTIKITYSVAPTWVWIWETQ